MKDLFSSTPIIQRAYLVKVDYSDPSAYEVALCVRSEKPDESFIKTIGNVFADQYGANQHLDILFLGETADRATPGSSRIVFPPPEGAE